MACFIFGRFEIQTLTQNRFKNWTNDKLKLLGHNCNHLQEFVKSLLLLLFVKSLLKHFYKITNSGKLYQCSSCYAKLEQHCIQSLLHKKLAHSISGRIEKNFPNCGLISIFLNGTFILLFLNLESSILNLQVAIREFSWKSPAEEISNFSVK